MKLKRNKKAFTIIELLVVIAILSILVLLATPRFGGHIKDAHYAKSINNAKSLQDASQLYYMDHEDWPRLTDEPYTSEQLEEFSERIYDITGREVELDPEGNYYDIDYEALSNYAKVPDNKKNYILQNPIGKVFYMENLTEPGSTRVEYNTGKKANQETPSLPSISNITDTSVTIDGAEGAEVSLGDGVWHDSPHIFTNLEEETSYTAYSRYKETESHYASKISEVVIFSTIITPKEPSSFAHTRSSQTFVAPTSGKYKLEVWGAQGGSHAGNYGGKGGYSYGETTLIKGETLYIFVGDQGGNVKYPNGGIGGWNGGGSGGNGLHGFTGANLGGGGGGATDIRKINGGWDTLSSLNSRIIVAGAGGGGISSLDGYGGAGGGLVGVTGTGRERAGTGGSQTTGGTGSAGSSKGGNGIFGKGGSGAGGARSGAGGGGGYYGGGGGGGSNYYGSNGGGGSSYISGVQNGETIAGNQSMPNPDGGNMTGNSGNGFARITYIGN